MDNFNNGSEFNGVNGDIQNSGSVDTRNINGGMHNNNMPNGGMYGGNMYGAPSNRPPVKRTSKVVIVSIIVAIVALNLIVIIGTIGLTYFAVSKEKEPASVKDFVEECQDRGFVVTDVTSLASNIQAKIAYSAELDGVTQEYEFYFFQFENDNKAKQVFNDYKTKYKEDEESMPIKSEINMKNYGSYKLKGKGRVRYISFIGNTMISVDVHEEYEEQIMKVLDAMDY